MGSPMRFVLLVASGMLLIPVVAACQPSSDYYGFKAQVLDGHQLVFETPTNLRAGGDTCADDYKPIQFDGRFVAWRDRGGLQVWDINSKEKMQYALDGDFGRGQILLESGFELYAQNLTNNYQSIRVPPPDGGNWVGTGNAFAWAIGAEGRISVYDAVKRQYVASNVVPPTGNATIFGADGNTIATGHARDSFWLYNIKTKTWLKASALVGYENGWRSIGLLEGRLTFQQPGQTGGGRIYYTQAQLDPITGNWTFGNPGPVKLGNMTARMSSFLLPPSGDTTTTYDAAGNVVATSTAGSSQAAAGVGALVAVMLAGLAWTRRRLQ